MQDVLELSHRGVMALEGMKADRMGLHGSGVAQLWTPSREHSDKLLLAQEVFFDNLITQVGDQYYGERAAGIGSPPNQVTGMRLGTGSTAVAKTGAGAAIVTYTTGSNVAIDASSGKHSGAQALPQPQVSTRW